LKPVGSQPPRLYGLAKVHNDDVSLRPVLLSMPGSAYHNIIIEKKLNKLVDKNDEAAR